MSMRCVIGSSIVRGSSARMRETASLTSLTARSVGTPSSNWITVVELPSTTVELMCLTPVMPATASSTFLVTCVSSSDGAAPACVISTWTTGTSMLGKRDTGSWRKLNMPSAISTTNSSSGGTGLRIAQAETLMRLTDIGDWSMCDQRRACSICGGWQLTLRQFDPWRCVAGFDRR